MKKQKNKTTTVKTKRLVIIEDGGTAGKWTIKLQNSETVIGEVTVSELDWLAKTSEMEYEIFPEYKGDGYAAEAITAVTDFVFGKETIYFMRIPVLREDEAKGEMLTACGFAAINADDENAEVIVYEKEKPKSAYMAIYMMLGMSIGMSIGVSTDKMAVGMCIGMAAGMAIGLALDHSDANARKR